MSKILIDLCKSDADAAMTIEDRKSEGFDLAWSNRPTVARVVIHDQSTEDQLAGKNRVVLVFKERAPSG